MLGGLFKKSRLNKAVSAARKARKAEGAKAEQLFNQSYHLFAGLVQGELIQAEAMYRWGLALMDQARQVPGTDGEAMLEQAILRFESCRLLKADYLAAALDGGVAYLELAKRRNLPLDAPLYTQAALSFQQANQIQPCAAAYNQACLAALNSDSQGCKSFLEQARDHGVLPSDEDMASDHDLSNVRELSWFQEFLASLQEETTEQDQEAETASDETTSETAKTEQPDLSDTDSKEKTEIIDSSSNAPETVTDKKDSNTPAS